MTAETVFGVLLLLIVTEILIKTISAIARLFWILAWLTLLGGAVLRVS